MGISRVKEKAVVIITVVRRQFQQFVIQLSISHLLKKCINFDISDKCLHVQKGYPIYSSIYLLLTH